MSCLNIVNIILQKPVDIVQAMCKFYVRVMPVKKSQTTVYAALTAHILSETRDEST